MTNKKDVKPIRVHSLTPFDRSSKVRWLLLELGVEHETRWLNFEKKEIESPEYLNLNPMGRVPVIEINGTAIFESGAICAYLADLYLDKGMAPKLDAPERAKYQQWMYFASATADTLQTCIMIIEDIPAGEVRTEKETALFSQLRDAMSALNATLAHDEYLVGNKFSAADICVGYHLYFLQLWPEFMGIMKDFPKVLSFIERLKARPAVVKSGALSYED